LAVVLDGFATLQAIEENLEGIVEVGKHILVIYICRKFEVTVDTGISQGALHEE
jgi:hypothetical protein